MTVDGLPTCVASFLWRFIWLLIYFIHSSLLRKSHQPLVAGVPRIYSTFSPLGDEKNSNWPFLSVFRITFLILFFFSLRSTIQILVGLSSSPTLSMVSLSTKNWPQAVLRLSSTVLNTSKVHLQLMLWCTSRHHHLKQVAGWRCTISPAICEVHWHEGTRTPSGVRLIVYWRCWTAIGSFMATYDPTMWCSKSMKMANCNFQLQGRTSISGSWTSTGQVAVVRSVTRCTVTSSSFQAGLVCLEHRLLWGMITRWWIYSGLPYFVHNSFILFLIVCTFFDIVDD